jgi:hypothetical protein
MEYYENMKIHNGCRACPRLHQNVWRRGILAINGSGFFIVR